MNAADFHLDPKCVPTRTRRPKEGQVIAGGLESGSRNIKVVFARFQNVKIELPGVGGGGLRDGICTSEYRHRYARDGSAVRANDDTANTAHFRGLVNTYVGWQSYNCYGQKCSCNTHNSDPSYDCLHSVNCMLACS